MGGALQVIMSMLSLTQTMGTEGNKYVAYGISKVLYKMMGCIYRSILYFNIATVLLDTYSRRINMGCRSTQPVSEIRIAKERCSQDVNCVGFYSPVDSDQYWLCFRPLQISASSYECILYLREIGKLTNAYAIHNDCEK